MSRYTPADDLMLAIHEQVIAARATRDRPLTRGQINASRKECGAIVGQALDRLVDGGLLATMRLTRDSTTHDFYWPTGIQPITPPTDEERRMSTESKTDRLVRLITTHGGRINAVELSAKARAEGYDIPAKNVQGLLTARVNRGDIELIRDGKATYYDTPSKKTAAILDASADDDAMPQADPVMLALANRELGDKLSAALADQQAAERALQEANYDLSRYRAMLDLIADRLGCDTHNGIPATIDNLLTTRDVSTGRLALLSYTNGYDAALDYLEPYVSEEDAEKIAINQLNDKHADRVSVIRVLGTAIRPEPIYSAEITPPIRTLHDQPTHEGA